VSFVLRLCAVFSIVTSVGLGTAYAGNGTKPVAITKFDTAFRAALAKHKIPGAAYAIIEGEKITAVRTYGTRAKGKNLPVGESTVFRLASVSKTFSSELAAMLIAEGKLSWNDKVVDYVPNFRLKTAGHAEQLSIGHILSHSTGLLPNSYDVMLNDGWSMEKIIPRFKKLKPMCKPGKCYGYQNIVFSFIEPVLEKSTGKTFENLMRERLFKPLGLQNTTIGYDAFLQAPNRAAPHVLTKKGWHKTKVNTHYYTVSPAAGVNATVVDLAKWVRAQMGHNADVLNESLLKTVTTKRVKTKRELYRKVWRPHIDDAHYGYGWRIYNISGEDIILHAGGVAGFRSLISYSKDRNIGHVMLMNAESRSIDELGANFWASLIAEKPATIIAAGR